MVKDLPDKAGDADSIPGSRISPRGGNGNPLQHSSILAWEIPCTEEAGRLQSMASQQSQTLNSYNKKLK